MLSGCLRPSAPFGSASWRLLVARRSFSVPNVPLLWALLVEALRWATVNERGWRSGSRPASRRSAWCMRPFSFLSFAHIARVSVSLPAHAAVGTRRLTSSHRGFVSSWRATSPTLAILACAEVLSQSAQLPANELVYVPHCPIAAAHLRPLVTRCWLCSSTFEVQGPMLDPCSNCLLLVSSILPWRTVY